MLSSCLKLQLRVCVLLQTDLVAAATCPVPLTGVRVCIKGHRMTQLASHLLAKDLVCCQVCGRLVTTHAHTHARTHTHTHTHTHTQTVGSLHQRRGGGASAFGTEPQVPVKHTNFHCEPIHTFSATPQFLVYSPSSAHRAKRRPLLSF